MLSLEQHQMLAALGIPTGPPSAGPGEIPPAASWVKPQFPSLMNPQWMDSFQIMQALAPGGMGSPGGPGR
jgi:hypothetical protein